MQRRRPTNKILNISLKYSTPLFHLNANNLNFSEFYHFRIFSIFTSTLYHFRCIGYWKACKSVHR